MNRFAKIEGLLASMFPTGQLGLGLELANNRKQEWQDCLDQFSYVPVGYAQPHIEYQHTYFSALNPDYCRFDILVNWRGRAIGLWPLAWVGREEGPGYFSSHVNGALGIAPPLLADDLSEKQEKTITRAWFGIVATLCRDFAVSSVNLAAQHYQQDLPYWHRLSMSLGATVSCKHQLVVDLTIPATDYHRHLRKSYKSLINTAGRLWHSDINVRGDSEAFAEFEALHEFVAGRKTRPPETWHAQLEAITAGDAFAVYLRDKAHRMVGASLINVSRDEAHYAVGAYDRALFDQPLAHMSVYDSICFARQLGLKRFILGQRPYPGDAQSPSEKEKQIAFFKEGFATGLQLLPILHLSAAQIQPFAQSTQLL